MDSAEKAAMSVLKVNGTGYNIQLFEKQSVVKEAFLCAACNSVCDDPSELGCQHDEDDADILVYCRQCLQQHINDNHGKCPINSHEDPVIISNRSIRTKIAKMTVYCPFSDAYKHGQNQNEEKQESAACQWTGKLSDLVKNHIAECYKKNFDPTSVLKVNGKGYSIRLFAKQAAVSAFVCDSCKSVCDNPSELGCDHDDDVDISLYCQQCLQQLIHENAAKCPINSHDDPVVVSNRSIRTKISKSTVFCPFSAAYKQANDDASTDMDAEAKHDNTEQSDMCEWTGKLSDLVKQHIAECFNKNNNVASSSRSEIKPKKNINVQQESEPAFDNLWRFRVPAEFSKDEEWPIMRVLDDDESGRKLEFRNWRIPVVGNCHFVPFGPLLKGNEVIAVQFEMQKVGQSEDYLFGVVTDEYGDKYFKNYTHSMFVQGNGWIDARDEFVECNRQNMTSMPYDGILCGDDKSWKRKVLNGVDFMASSAAKTWKMKISVNMTTRTAMISNSEHSVKVILPPNTAIQMVLGFKGGGGYNWKYVTATKANR